jgi:hypothetical protein
MDEIRVLLRNKKVPNHDIKERIKHLKKEHLENLNTELLNYCIQSFELIQYIIELGGSPNYIVFIGRLPIFDAIVYRQHDVAKYLFQHTDFKTTDMYACQAFRYLFDTNYTEFFQLIRNILFQCTRDHILSGRRSYRLLKYRYRFIV